MATARYEDPSRRWGWIHWGLPARQPLQGRIEEYQAQDEGMLAVAGRHPVVLVPTIGICCAVAAIGLRTEVRVAVVPLAIAFLVWRVWQWRVACYVLTRRRLLFVDGIVYAKVEALPLVLVADVTYRQSLAGRLLGYGDLTLTIEDQERRTLTRLTQAASLYVAMLRQIAVRDADRAR